MFFTRLIRPFLTFDGDELAGAAAPEVVETPAADQVAADVTPTETPATDQVTAEQDPTESETPETAEESFTDLDVSALPEEVQARAKEMQADYTRKTQALAERHAQLDNATEFIADLVSDDEPNETQEAVFKTLAAKLGYDIEDIEDLEHADVTPDAEGEETEELSDRDKFVDQLRAEKATEAETKAAAEREAHLDQIETQITDGITALAKADGVELSEHELDVIFDSVLGLPPHEGGPAVQAAYDRYKAATKAHTDRWVKSKTTTQIPGGKTAEDPVDFSNEEERLAYTARAVEAAQRAQSGL